MKILHIGKYYPPFFGGMENFLFDLVNQQTHEGHQVSVIVHHHLGKRQFAKEFSNETRLYRVRIFGKFAYTPLSPAFGYHLNQVIGEEKPEILHIHLPNVSAFWCLFLATARKIPWVIHWHADVLGSDPDLKVKMLYPFYRMFETLLLRKAKNVIATSLVYANSSEPLKKVVNKVAVIPLGLVQPIGLAQRIGLVQENSIKSNNQQKQLLSGETLNLLMIGRLTYYKGHQIMLEAMFELNKKNVKINLIIVGTGELTKQIQCLIESFQLNNQVQLQGKLTEENLNKELQATDLLCLTSIERTEAFGVVLLEAMRASKPCLVTDVAGSGMSWVVKENETGFVVPSKRVDSLVVKLTEIAGNKAMLKDMGEAGRLRFEKHFTIQAISQQITLLYQSLVS